MSEGHEIPGAAFVSPTSNSLKEVSPVAVAEDPSLLLVVADQVEGASNFLTT